MEEEQKKVERNIQRENRAARENKETTNAVYDENYNLVDLDDIMSGDFLVVRKLKNLTDFGVTEEQIKKIFGMTAEISFGDDIEQVLEELEKIFLVLANQISIAPNGIVIDLATGKEDEILSRIQCNELNIDYDTIRDVPEVKRREDFSELFDQIKPEDVKSVDINLYSTFYEYYDHEVAAIIDGLNLTKDEKKTLENDLREESISATIIEYLNNLSQNKIDNEFTYEEREELIAFLKRNCNSQEYKYILDKIGDIDNIKVSDVTTFLDEWEKSSDNVDLINQINDFKKKIDGIESYENLPLELRDELEKILSKVHISESELVKRLGKELCENLKLDLDNLSINQDPEEHVTREEKIQAKKEKQSKIFKKSYIYKLINEKLSNVNDVNNSKALILISLYKEYYEEGKQSNEAEVIKNILEDYIKEKEAKQYFEEAFKDRSIFRKDGKLSIRAINDILKNVELTADIVELKDSIKTDVINLNNKLNEIKKRESDKVENLRSLIDGANGQSEIGEQDEKQVLDQIDNINIATLTVDLIEGIRGLNSEKINAKLDEKFGNINDITNKDVFKIKNLRDLSVEQKRIYNAITRRIGGTEKEGFDPRGLEIIELYKYYYENEGKNPDSATVAIEEYIKDQKEYFQKYFAEYEGNTIFNKDGSISITKISRILERIKLDDKSQAKIDGIEEEIAQRKLLIAQYRENDSENLEKINELASNISSENKAEIQELIALLGAIDERSLSKKEIDLLRNIKSRELNAELNSIIKRSPIYEKKLYTYGSMEAELSNEKKAVLLMEARLEFSKGTPEYDKVMKDREDFYNSNSGYKEILANMRDESGSLTKSGRSEFNYYINGLIDEKIIRNIEGKNIADLDEASRKKYITLLLIGTKSKENMVKEKSLSQLRNIYSREVDFDNSSLGKIETEIYNLEFGTKLKPDEVKKRIRQLRNTLGKRTVEQEQSKNRSMSEKIKDMSKMSNEEFDIIFNEKSEELVTSAIDFRESKIQGFFKSSRIKFTQKDEEMFNDLYANAVVNSYIDNEKDAKSFYLANLLLNKEELSKISDSNRAKEFYTNIEETIQGYLLENNGHEFNRSEIKSAKSKIKQYRENKVDEELLSEFLNSANNMQDFESINPGKQNERIVRILTARERAEKTSNPDLKNMLIKLANRELELMNTKDKKFISFDENGNEVINKKLILQEYNNNISETQTKDKMNTFEELKLYSVYNYKADRLQSELYNYQSSSFIFRKLESETLIGKLAEIENIRLEEEQRLILRQSETDKKFEEAKKKVQGEPELQNDKNGKFSIIDRIKGIINSFGQPKLTDGAEKNQGNSIISKIVDGVKGIFSKNDYGVTPIEGNANPYYKSSNSWDLSQEEKNKVNSYANAKEKVSLNEQDKNSPSIQSNKEDEEISI